MYEYKYEYYDSDDYGEGSYLEDDSRRAGVFSRLLRPLTVTAGFVWDWVTSRPIGSLFASIPAIVLVVGAIVITATREASRKELLPRYSAAALRSLDENNLDAADLCFQRLTRLGKPNPAAVYGRALVAERRGDEAAAERLMRTIATGDSPLATRVHFWLAQRIARKQSASSREMTAEDAREYLRHLQRALEGDPGNLEAHAMLGMFFFANGAYAKAVDHLTLGAEEKPELWIAAARSYAILGRVIEARSAAEKSIDAFQQRVARNPDNVDDRVLLAQSLAFLSRFSEAEEALKTNLRETNDPRLRRSASNLLVAWFKTSWRTKSQGRLTLLDLLKRAIDYDPENPDILICFAQLCNDQYDEAAREARKLLDPFLKANKAPGQVYFILGTGDLLRGDFASAIPRLQKANRLKPKDPDILNNLGWAYAYCDSPQLELALSLSEEAVKQRPNDPGLRETRGQILAKLGRYHDALSDLEFALEHTKDTPEVHKTLALVCDKLGLTELARTHRALSDEPPRR